MSMQSNTHSDFAYDVKISNDNTKAEKRATIHVRSDTMDPHEVVKLAKQLYEESLE